MHVLAYQNMNALVALTMLGLIGIGLIWQGLTGDVMKSPLGDNIVPRWMYIVAGIVLLLFPIAWFIVAFHPEHLTGK